MKLISNMEIKIKKLDKNAVIPKYSKYGDAGMDLARHPACCRCLDCRADVQPCQECPYLPDQLLDTDRCRLADLGVESEPGVHHHCSGNRGISLW